MYGYGKVHMYFGSEASDGSVHLEDLLTLPFLLHRVLDSDQRGQLARPLSLKTSHDALKGMPMLTDERYEDTIYRNCLWIGTENRRC